MAPGNNIDREGLKFFYDLTQGHAHDLSGNGYDLLPINGQCFFKNKGGYVYQPKASFGALYRTFAADASLNLFEKAFTVVISCITTSSTPVKTVAYSGGYAGIFYLTAGFPNLTCWSFFNGTSLYIGDSVDNTGFSLLNKFSNLVSLAIVKPAGNVKADLYINGIWDSESAAIFNCADSNPTELYVGRSFALNDEANMLTRAFAFYLAEKDSDQIAAIHESLLDLHTPHTGSRRFYSTPSVHANQPNLVAGWNMEKQNGIVPDVKGVNNGTPVGTVIQTRTPWGEPCLDLQGGHVNCGNDSSLDFTSEKIGIMLWQMPSSIGVPTQQVLLCRGASSADGYFIQNFNTGAVGAAASQPASFSVAQSAPRATQNNIWDHVAVFKESGEFPQIYFNTENETNVTGGNTLQPSTSARNFYLGRYDATGFEFKGKIAAPQIGTFASKAEFEALLKAEYNRVASICLLHIDFDSSPTDRVWSAGQTIDGTPIQVVSGTWQVVWDSALYKKVLECVTDGKVKVQPPRGNEAFGTTRWKMLKGGAANVSTCYIVATDDTPTSGYSFSFEADESVKMAEVGVGDKFQTAASYIAINTWYECEPARTTEGVTTAFIDDVQVVEDSGANPFTDLTVVTNKAILYDLDAGDRIADIEKLFGVPIP